ncbi:MAG: anti-sigma factor [Ferruginibacter sp.]
MNAQEIISSGILELYCTGLTSAAETADVELWAKQYPEVAAEIEAIQMSMEGYAQSHAVAPGASVKEKIFAEINSGKITTVADIKKSAVETAKVYSLKNYWKMAAAASILLLIGSTVLNVIFYNKFNSTSKDLENTQQALALETQRSRGMEVDMGVIQSKYSEPVKLNGLEAAPDAVAKIFWMKNTGEVFIDPSNLPAVPSGMQYQLWAIVDGKPVDAGMIKSENKSHIQKMKSFGRAEAFAVTLETAGGNPTPKGNMYVMGKI